MTTPESLVAGGGPELGDLAQLIAMADTYEVVWLRLPRAIRDVS